MIFSSLEFILFFLVFSICIKYLRNYQQALIIISSFIFYSFWNSIFFILLVYLCLSNFYFIKKKINIYFAVTASLLPLFYFKYSYFFSNVFNLEILSEYSYKGELPLAISFITFTALATIIDTKLNKHNENLDIKNFTEFLVYFPQLIAGPILRVNQLIPQLKNKIEFNESNIKFGLVLFTIGFVKKIFLADNIGSYIDPFFEDPILHSDNVIKGFFLFPLQIYFDFSGYIDMALGSSIILGIHLPQNFTKPYLSESLTKFWRNWHITLSSWFRDYLYIPLGGSKKSKKKLFFNLTFVMSIAGLWHGASLNFILWGFLNGFILFFEKMINKSFEIPNILKIIITCFIVFNLWIVFRISDFSHLINFFIELYSNIEKIFLFENLVIFLILILGVISQKFEELKNIRKFSHKISFFFLIPFILVIILTGLGINAGTSEKFIYFQF